LKPIRKIRLSESIIKAIKEMIVEEGFEHEDKFYSENELTKKLQVSRASVREAIRILEVKGEVIVKQGKGVYITDINAEKFQPFIHWLKTNEQSITDLFEVSLIIDPKAAAYAAQKANNNDIRKMEDICTQFEFHAKSNRTADIIKYDRAFHRCLAKATKNLTLYALMESMTTAFPDGRISSLHTPGRVEKTIQEHRAIIKAVKNRDKDSAEQAMELHIKNALREIISHLKVQQLENQ
jgi:GntR family transcriptional repressor for pyruvate dehydrogenase complex